MARRVNFPQVVDTLKVPEIAAGGIADAPLCRLGGKWSNRTSRLFGLVNRFVWPVNFPRERLHSGLRRVRALPWKGLRDSGRGRALWRIKSMPKKGAVAVNYQCAFPDRV